MRKEYKYMREQQKIIKNKQNGITLIALVVTIVILLILAGISITLVLGPNGLITKSQEAVLKTENASAEEYEILANADYQLNTLISQVIPNDDETSGGEDVELPDDDDVFVPQPTPEPDHGEEGETIPEFDRLYGVIEIKWLEGATDYVSETPNAPVIKTEGLPAGVTMTQVVYDAGTNSWIPGTDYSYSQGSGTNDNTSSKWANARVTINGVDSYFVWIPRYAYRIIYFADSDSKTKYQQGLLTEEDALAQGKVNGYSDSRGIVTAEGKKVTDIPSTTKIMVSEDYFMVHPAFLDGEAVGYANGEWGEDIEGIWVAKYETSSVQGNSESSADNVITKTAKVQAGASSWRNIQIGNAYTVSRNFLPSLQSHMLKNSEWGAVVYLTESTYGRNGNYVAKSDQGYITGGGAGNAYLTYTNQSSTGNEYGIFDLNGCSKEFVACYI